MKKTIQKSLACFLIAALMLGVFGMPAVQVQAASTTGKVTSSILNIRESASTSAAKVTVLSKGKKVTVLETGKTWVKVSVDGMVGYTQGKYIQTSHGTASNPYKNAISGTVNTNVLNIRSSKSTSSKCLATLSKSAKVQVLSTGSTWVKVKVGDIIGYTKGKYIKTKNGTASDNNSYSGKGAALVAYAKRFLGNPYVWGGESLTHGADCSGFVKALYRHYGKSLPHSSYALRHVGRAVKGGIKNAKPGDIICYSGHVAIYMGGNKVIHASNPSTGIKITKNASYRHIVAIRRIF